MATVQIEARGTAQAVAPAGIWLEATNPQGFAVSEPAPGAAYDPTFHEITYIWTVRGAPLPAFTTPLNIVDAWKSPNIAYGKKVAFAFNDPGSYDIDLWAVDENGATATATRRITVADPDVVFAGAKTICYAPSGDFTGAPDGAQWVITRDDFEAALHAVGGVGARGLLRADETFPGFFLETRDIDGIMRIGRFGAGARPVIALGDVAPFGFGTGARPVDYGLHDLHFAGPWDSHTETGRKQSALSLAGGSKTWDNAENAFFVHRCSFDGVNLNTMPTVAKTTTILSEIHCTNWGNMGFFFGQGSQPETRRVAFIGCVIAQDPEALQGNHENPLGNQHGPVRIEAEGSVSVRSSDFFSRNSWSGRFSDQPAFRVNTSTPEGVFYNFDRIVAEGGTDGVIKLDGQNNGQTERAGNFLLDKFLIMGTARTQKHIKSSYGGVTKRNGIFWMPDVPHDAYGIDNGMISYEIDNDDITNRATPVRDYSLTFLSEITTANNKIRNGAAENVAAFKGEEVFDDLDIVNYVFHAPNQDAAVTGDLPLDLGTSVPGVTPRYDAVRRAHPTIDGTFSSDIPDGGTLTIAYPAGLDSSYPHWGDNNALRLKSNTALYEIEAEIQTAFSGAGIVVKNLSGETWQSGADYKFLADRSGDLPAPEPAYGSPGSVPLVVPQSTSPAWQSATTGKVAYDDFFGTVRPGRIDWQTGQLVPGTPSKGAVEP